ncbi:hypothetical protein MVEN_01564100 [Mycena venus]|uniref:MYND-type domain-containing protein n=1 Tax=Mycena venus TaxID=2733690 RepID=A0A8H7CPL5_9AGAR|nr:hypothetical protein MVEN_01564100 [Mycena venus]
MSLSAYSLLMPGAWPEPEASSPVLAQNLGTWSNGQTIPHVLCANNSDSKSSTSICCLQPGTMTCSKCHLVKAGLRSRQYCSSACQAQHWKTHKNDCKHPYNSSSWLPAWTTEKRTPAFIDKTNEGPQHTFFGTFGNYLWGNVPAINCLQHVRNEGHPAAAMDLKFCFAASGDIRNLVLTVNDLPDNYTGKCTILFNDINGIVVNRNLVILFVLLTAGADVAEAAELAVHLMYSAALTPAMANYVRQCIETIYGTHGPQSGVWDTRGAGKLRSLQRMSDIQLALQMFRSQYKLQVAFANMHSVMWSPERVDYRDRYLASLEPGHRVSFYRFRTTGVLAPFSVDVGHFTEPNRLLFSPDGGWLTMDNANPLFGWDLGPVFECGKRNGATRDDAYGCLFFYLKEQFQKFATRARDFELDITLSQADAQVLSQAIIIGRVQNLPKVARFDRIETSNLGDYFGASRVITDWAPLLNKANPYSVLLMNFMNWPLKDTALPSPDDEHKVNRKILQQSAEILGFSPAQMFTHGTYSSQIITMMECMEAFYDNERPFSEFLTNAGALQTAVSAGVRLRQTHRIHPKRSGLVLENPNQTVPNLTKTEFYDLFLLGGANYSDRFVEVEVRA